jgi:hypothetical protein
MNKPYTLTQQQRDDIARRYAAGESGSALSREYGISTACVYSACRTRGVARRSSQTVLHDKCRALNPCNDAAFDELTPDALYWIGFLWADGCVRRNRIGLTLASRDKEHVDAFRRFCGCSNGTIKGRSDGHGHFSSGFVMYSLHATQRLAALGFIGTKKERVPPAALATSAHFWRGVIDGDGTVGVYKTRRWAGERISLVGGHGTINAFLEYARAVTGPHSSHLSDCGNYAQMQFSGGRAYDLLGILYGHGGTALARKAEKAMGILRDRADVQRRVVGARKGGYIRRAA